MVVQKEFKRSYLLTFSIKKAGGEESFTEHNERALDLYGIK